MRQQYRNIFFSVSVAVSSLLLCGVCVAGDWPMWRYDANRSAASPHDLPQELQARWTWKFEPRRQVWDDPLNHDLMQYDRVLEPIIVGGRVYVGFNDTDKVLALDLETGEELWTFYTDGPVRLPVASWRDRIFCTSDDGYLYCLNAASGELVWKFRGGPAELHCIGNRRVISLWPARGGPLVRDDKVYFAASIWPFMGTFLYALNAADGTVHWVNDGSGAVYIKQPHSAPSFGGVGPQGALVASHDTLLVPGGRSVPAAFDINTGALRYYRINDGGKGVGGSFVAANDDKYFVHTRKRGVIQFDIEKGEKEEFKSNEPVLHGKTLYTATDKAVMALDENRKVIWRIAADGRGDLIKAGRRLYAAGKDRIAAIRLPSDGGRAEVEWSISVGSKVERLLAGGDHLLAVTLDGQILAFGGEQGSHVVHESKPSQLESLVASDEMVRRTTQRAKVDSGIAFWCGAQNENLLDSLLKQTQLHVVVLDEDPQRVARLRERYDAMGLYGQRVVVHPQASATYAAPPYVANLVVLDATDLTSQQALELSRKWYETVRPYGGAMWCLTAGDEQRSELGGLIRQAALAKSSIDEEAELLVFREGSLPDSAPWTHNYGDVANTVKSNDKRVKPPFGVLWFGGNSNVDTLPRHGHGPPEQVIGGRLFVQGVNSLSARDVYTGRVLWKREFQDLDTYNVYFDPTYKHTPLNPAYNQVHIPGANSRGTNVIATEDAVYLVIQNRCLVLDPETGRNLRVLELPPDEEGNQPGDWTYIGIYGDILLAGSEFANYTKRLDGVKYDATNKKGVAWSPDLFGSLGLVAMHRETGEVLWRVDARHSFLHNGIVAGNGRVYLLDKLPKSVEEQLARRGKANPDDYQLLCLDVQTGELIWDTKGNVFGTWLSYSAKHDVLLHAGAAAPDRSQEEVGQGMAAYRGATGRQLWRKREVEYAGPCILFNDWVITNSKSYTSSSGVYHLLSGDPVMVDNPITGKMEPWRYTRAYGCNTAVACENFLSFRSGAAGYYDMNTRSGTANLGGFRSGCSSNLIAADGILNAPDYTRTCSCGYQNQTSLGLIHMPEIEMWSVAPHDGFADDGRVVRLGLNLGAPGDRKDVDGTLWVEYPVVAGTSPPIEVELDGEDLQYFRRHTSAIQNDLLPWVGASGLKGSGRFTARLLAEAESDKEDDEKRKRPTKSDGKKHNYRLRFVFVEPDDVEQGQRVFDVLVDGRTVLKDVDVLKEAGGRLKSMLRETELLELADEVSISLVAASGSELPPVISGIELLKQ